MARTAARTGNAKASWYGSHDSLIDATRLKGNLGRVLKAKEDGVTYVALSAERKSDVTKGLKKLCGSDSTIEYHNPVVCRKRKGAVVEIDGVTRIWVGVVSGKAEEVSAKQVKPEKAAKAVKAVKSTKAAKKEPEITKDQAMEQLKEMQAQMAKLMEVLA